jgi:hypothetical protein
MNIQDSVRAISAGLAAESDGHFNAYEVVVGLRNTDMIVTYRQVQTALYRLRKKFNDFYHVEYGHYRFVDARQS